jgi:hypothetical protein
MIQLNNAIEVLQGLTGKTFDTIYDLFFTEKKLVVAVVLHPSDFAREYRKPDSLLSIFLGNTRKSQEIKTRSMKLIEERRLAFKNKNLDEILAMSQFNMKIDYENITSVTVKKGLLTTWLEFKFQNYRTRKISFSLKKSQITEVERIISKILPDKFVTTS